jgi:hypothetical protein
MRMIEEGNGYRVFDTEEYQILNESNKAFIRRMVLQRIPWSYDHIPEEDYIEVVVEEP